MSARYSEFMERIVAGEENEELDGILEQLMAIGRGLTDA
jgi:hypothetical protein